MNREGEKILLLDPLTYLINQNRLEVNRRSSDDLRMQRHKEVKEKERPSSELPEDLSSDLSTMSDDLLGDMDPDLFGKGGPSYHRPDEDFEESSNDRDKDKDQDKEQGSEDREEDSHESRPDSSDGEGPPSPSEGAASTFSCECVDSSLAALPPEPPPPIVAEASPKSAPSSEEGGSAPPELPTAHGRLPETRTTESPAHTSSPDRAQISTPKGGAGGGVFFDPSHGFLIAEEFQADMLSEPEPEPAEERPEPVAPELSEVLDKIIIGDVSCLAYRKLQVLLARFGRGVLRQCLDCGTKVYLLPPDAPLTAHPLLANSLDGQAEDAAYLVSARACVFETACLTRPPYGFHPVLFYFGYAYDHALGGEDFVSLHSPAVQASYQACLKAPSRLTDELAGLSPIHYFAHAVASYLGENDCSEPIWTRQDLYDFDRSMYEYVDYLFKRHRS